MENRKRFYSVPDVADMFEVSEATLYRLLRAGQFPALKLRGRYIIPVAALDAMEAAALSGATIDVASFQWQSTASQPTGHSRCCCCQH